jgi:hypothetical protein
MKGAADDDFIPKNVIGLISLFESIVENLETLVFSQSLPFTGEPCVRDFASTDCDSKRADQQVRPEVTSIRSR